jgi:DNA-binding NarL/FixJ family response regulator
VATLTTRRLDPPTLDGMNTTTTTAPFAGLLSLVADSTGTDSATPSTAVAPPTHDLASALGQLIQGWAAVKEGGDGWVLLHFAPSTASPAATAASYDEQPTVTPRPIPTRPDFGARARRVHTALTDREREVLCLVAGGATNRIIAARLFISPKTASVHVSRILTKLDATTRTEAAALAHASGLVRPWGTVEPQAVNA